MRELAEDHFAESAFTWEGETPESYAFRKLRGGLMAGGSPNIHRKNVAKSLYAEGYLEF